MKKKMYIIPEKEYYEDFQVAFFEMETGDRPALKRKESYEKEK